MSDFTKTATDAQQIVRQLRNDPHGQETVQALHNELKESSAEYQELFIKNDRLGAAAMCQQQLAKVIIGYFEDGMPACPKAIVSFFFKQGIVAPGRSAQENKDIIRTAINDLVFYEKKTAEKVKVFLKELLPKLDVYIDDFAGQNHLNNKLLLEAHRRYLDTVADKEKK